MSADGLPLAEAEGAPAPAGRGAGLERAALAALGLGVAALLAGRSPLYPDHWDEYNLAYGVEDFDLTRHQPHPPGYLLFLALGRLLLPLAGDAVRALQWSAALAVGVWVLLVGGAAPTGRRLALGGLAAAFALCSPLLDQYAPVGLTYTAEGAVWTALALAIARRPRGAGLLALGFAVGLAGGLRQTLTVWGVALLGLEALRSRAWPGARALAGLGAGLALGVLAWLGPLLHEAGGWTAWREASAGILSGNIWRKSLLHTGLAGLAGRARMLPDLALGLGPLLPAGLALGVLRRGRGPLLGALDPLALAGLLSLGFYGLLIYDTSGYMVAVTLALGAWVLLGLERLGAAAPPRARALGAVGALALLALTPRLPWVQERVGGPPGARRAAHDALLGARFAAARAATDPARTVLVTSQEYWRYGLRHVGNALPEWTTVQLVPDPFVPRAGPDAPYLVSRGRRLDAAGPAELELASLLPPGALAQVLYMVPDDYAQHLDPRCLAGARAVLTSQGERLPLIDAQAGAVRVRRGRLVCGD